ncbi:MAG TPA: spore germination protein GerW family protein [Terriglobia bacterium]|nr:spore germination protein GerW family protein [Terriglobia bacterium]
MNPAEEILKGLIGELKDMAKTETIVGAPITMGEYVIVPISRVSLGVGAGGGVGESDGKEKRGGSGQGGGGGGGIRVHPVALVAVHGSELTVHRLGAGGSLGRTVERMPDVLEATLEKAFDLWQARKGNDQKQGS